MMSVPSAWMSMRMETNSESCRALMVSFLKFKSVNSAGVKTIATAANNNTPEKS